MRHEDALRQSVQRLRAERFEDLPAGLVDEILDIEAAHVEERDVALDKVTTAIHGAAKLQVAKSSEK